MEYLLPEMKGSKKIVVAAITSYLSYWNVLKYAAKELEMDKDVIRFECSRYGGYDGKRKDAIIKYFEKDEEFLKELSLLKPEYFCKEHFWSTNKEEALYAITNSKFMFTHHLHKFWSHDRDVVLAAVKRDGKALRFASDELKQLVLIFKMITRV